MYISLTFDDGWKSQYDNAVPILNNYQFKATFYIITQYMYTEDSNYMNFGTVINLFKQGHEIGAHTATHPNLTINNEFIEISRSLIDLQYFGLPVKSFAYPYGKYNEIVKNYVREFGFENARAVRLGQSRSVAPFTLDNFASITN